MLCGFGVPSLRSLWGAVRNRQLYILHMYCKSCISFNFFNFSLLIYTIYRKKIQFFIIIYTIYRTKKFTRIYRKKKIQDLTIFWYNSYIFHILMRQGKDKKYLDSSMRGLSLHSHFFDLLQF